MSEPGDRLPVVYIAGPYRAPTPWRILRNIQRAREVSLAIWKLGAVALCPHANTALFDGEADDSVWLQGDLELLRRCDAVVTLREFALSFGAKAERDFAIALGLPIFYAGDLVWVDNLKEWIDAWQVNRRTAARRSDRPGPDHVPDVADAIG